MSADSSPARRGIFVAPFEELAEPALVAELAARAEARGWDGFFIWDHVAYREPVQAVADPWVTLAAVAVATERVTIGAANSRPARLRCGVVNADPSPARSGIFVAPFEELAEPALVAELAARAEARGWDGFFIWDHVAYREPVQAVADPWVTLAAVAVATERVTIGALVTPVPRRRPHQLARETVTLDRLSGGRLVFAVGIGSDRTGEFDPARFGEEGDARARAVLLDDGLERLRGYWEGEFEPRPVNGSIPVWVAARWPHRRPLARAARWDGLFPIDLPGPEALAELAAEVHAMREPGPYDLVVTNPAGTDPAPWVEAGATWCLTGFGPQPTAAEVREAIDAGWA